MTERMNSSLLYGKTYETSKKQAICTYELLNTGTKQAIYHIKYLRPHTSFASYIIIIASLLRILQRCILWRGGN